MSDVMHPSTPMDFGFTRWKEVALRVKDRIAEERMSLVAAGVAFFAFLALFPAIAAIVAVGGLFIDPQQIASQAEALLAMMPEGVRNIIMGQISEIANEDGGGLGWAAVFGLALALYSASKGMANLMVGLNIVFEEEEDRGFIGEKLAALALTLFAVVCVIFAVVVMAVVPAILGFVSDAPLWTQVAEVVRWPLLILIAIVLFAVIYRHGPSRNDARWKWVAPGSILACILWVAATAGFTFYVSNFGSYNETFGTLGGVVVLLTWLWISAFIVLIGALIDAEIEAGLAKDTTTGPRQPRGNRDAVKADEYQRPNATGDEA